MSKEAKSYMQLALDQAERAGAAGEVPVGAVLVESFSGKIVAAAGNQVEELHDPTAHAEMLVLRLGGQRLCASRLPVCDLYVTLEPCPMCAQAISIARLRRLYFGAFDPKGGGVDHGPKIFAQSSCRHVPEVYGGIEEKASASLLRAFFSERR